MNDILLTFYSNEILHSLTQFFNSFIIYVCTG